VGGLYVVEERVNPNPPQCERGAAVCRWRTRRALSEGGGGGHVEYTEGGSQNLPPRSFLRWAASPFGVTVSFT